MKVEKMDLVMGSILRLRPVIKEGKIFDDSDGNPGILGEKCYPLGYEKNREG